VEWALWRPKDPWFSVELALNATFGDDHDVSGHLKLPVLGAFYWHINGIFSPSLKRRLPEGREISLKFYEEYLWINLWAMDPSEHWGKDENRFRWQRITWDWKRTLMGRMEYKLEQIGEPQVIVIPMPEGTYPATMQIERQTWRRTRWPWKKVRVSADIDLGRGIPVPGKGENSWDCGEDAICGMGSGPSVAEAVSTVVKRVLETRERYGGSSDWRPREKVNVR
jgi:hypothetical protein